jgi:hypothetical protein
VKSKLPVRSLDIYCSGTGIAYLITQVEILEHEREWRSFVN